MKMSGHFDVKTNMFIATCSQTLSVSNREILAESNANCFTANLDAKLRFEEVSTSVQHLLGYDLIRDRFYGKSLYELICPQSLSIVSQRHTQGELSLVVVSVLLSA